MDFNDIDNTRNARFTIDNTCTAPLWSCVDKRYLNYVVWGENAITTDIYKLTYLS